MKRLHPGAPTRGFLPPLLVSAFVACGLEAAGTGEPPTGAARGGDDDASAADTPSGEGDDSNDAAVMPPAPIADAATPTDAAFTCPPGETACAGACFQTATAVMHCGRCDHACAGTQATCTMGLCAATVHVRAYIDGKSTLEIKRGTARWIDSTDAVPGRWDGHDEPTTIDGAAFKPWAAFPLDAELRGRTEPSAAMTIPPVAARSPTAPAMPTAVQTSGRKVDRVSVIAMPSTANDFTLKVRFDDSNEGGADFYEADLRYETE